MTLPSPPAGAQAATRPDANDAEEMLDTFLYIVSHDLRAGLRAFATIPDWIVEDAAGLPPAQMHQIENHARMLRQQAQRCDQLLLDLRAYSRIGRMADTPGQHDLGPLLAEAAAQAALPATFGWQQAGGTARLNGPRNELIQLFAALFSNVHRHHDRDHGEIRVTVTPATDGLLQLDFADDGPGIAPDFHEAVFEPLRTLRPRDVVEGSGMGLTLARRILSGLGGRIHIPAVQADRGTCLRLTLPGRIDEPVH